MRAVAFGLLASLSALSCAPKFSNRQAAALRSGYVRDNLEKLYGMTALAFSNATGVSPPDAFERIDLSFSPSLFCCGGCFPGETPQHSGCTVTRFDGHYTMKVYVKDCPVDSSLIHEFLHVMSYEVLGELDADHQNPKIWAKNINQPELNPGAAFWLAKAAGYSSGLCDAL